jgi:radical SAM protein with 4Fe4S-binding SPASM domain
MRGLLQADLPMDNQAYSDFDAILAREKDIFQNKPDLPLLLAQCDEFIKLGKYDQAGRVISLMQRAMASKTKELDEYREPRYLLITSQPELYQNETKYHVVVHHTSDHDFVKNWLFVIYLYLKHPRIRGLVIENLQTLRDPAILQTLIEMAVSERKEISFARSPRLCLEQVEPKFREIIDNYRYINQPVPLSFNIIDSVGNCNLRCRMCPQTDHNYKLRIMADDLFQKTVEDIPAGAIVRISLTNFAEPLMIPGFVERLKFTAQARPKAYLKFNTNGTLLTEEIARELVLCGLTEIWFSLNMSTKEDYLWFTGRDLYEKACQNIQMMRRVREEMNSRHPLITVQQLSLPRNEGHYESFKAKWSPVADQVVVRPLSNWGGVVDIDREVMGNKPFGKYLANDFPCTALWQDLTINWQGDVYSCCIAACREEGVAGLRLGNVRNDCLMDIWQGQALFDLRLRQFTNLEPACLSCDAFKEAGEGTGLMLQAAIDRAFYQG